MKKIRIKLSPEQNNLKKKMINLTKQRIKYYEKELAILKTILSTLNPKGEE